MAQMVKNPPAMQETQVQSLGRENPLKKGMATHSSVLAWRIPWTIPWGCKESDMTEQLTHTHNHQHAFRMVHPHWVSTMSNPGANNKWCPHSQ